jgi:hypothetical protein
VDREHNLVLIDFPGSVKQRVSVRGSDIACAVQQELPRVREFVIPIVQSRSKQGFVAA